MLLRSSTRYSPTHFDSHEESGESSPPSHSSSESSFEMLACNISRISSAESFQGRDADDISRSGEGNDHENTDPPQEERHGSLDYRASANVYVSDAQTDMDDSGPASPFRSGVSGTIGPHDRQEQLDGTNTESFSDIASVSAKISSSYQLLTSFQSVLSDNEQWQTADEFTRKDYEHMYNSSDDDYDSDFTDDEQDDDDSFGPFQLQHKQLPQHAGIYEHEQEAFESSPHKLNITALTASTSSTSRSPRPRIDSIDYNANRYPSVNVSFSNESNVINDDRNNISFDVCPPSPLRRKLSLTIPLQPESPSLKFINKKSKQARQALKHKSTQARQALKHKSSLARQALRNSKTATKLQQIHKAYRKKRETRSRIIVIPANHRLKIIWDVATVILTFISAYMGHLQIRDRSTYDWDWFPLFSNIWYFVDILLNFCTEHRTSDGKIMKSGREVWGRYLTTWFAIDALSLLPWERMFMRPIIQAQKRRNIVVKWFFRSKAVVKVTRILKHRHFRAFGIVSKNTKKIGVGGKRLLQLIIKYVPKYILFYRNMKAVLLLKTLRQIHFARKIARNLAALETEDDEEEEDDGFETDDSGTVDYSGDLDSMSDIFKDDDSQEYSDDDTVSCSSSDDNHAIGNDSTDYESCLEDYDYDIRFSNFDIPGIKRSTTLANQFLDINTNGGNVYIQGNDNKADEF